MEKNPNEMNSNEKGIPISNEMNSNEKRIQIEKWIS